MRKTLELILKYYIYFIILLTFSFGLRLFDFSKKIFFHSDFFINYEYGFIRRGLDGQIIFLISKYFSLDPLNVQFFYSLFFFIVFVILLFIFFMTKKIPYYVIFSTSLFLIYILFLGTGIRKDHMLIIYFILLLVTLNAKIKVAYKYIWINIIFIVGILTHEVFLLISIFPTVYLLNDKKISFKILKKTIILSIPIVLFLLLSTTYKGDLISQNNIIKSWNEFPSLDLKFETGLFEGTFYIWNQNYSIIEYLGIMINLLIQFLFIFLTNKIFKKDNYKYFLIAQYLVCILLVIVAIDYSRWILFANITALMTVYTCNKENLFVPLNKNEELLILVFYLFLGIPYASWSVKSYLLTTPLLTPLNIYFWFQSL